MKSINVRIGICIRGKATDLNNIGMVYKQWGTPEKARIFEDLKDERSSAIVKGNINVFTQEV